MENSVNNCLSQRLFSNNLIRTRHEEEEEQDQEEESSWLFYFEDIDHEDEMSHYYDNDSSMISDAASPVYITKINNVNRRKAKSIKTNPKKRRINYQQEKEQQKGEEEEEEEEDTASSPSDKTKEIRCITDTGSKINEEFFSAELKKRGLCVVPISMLSNFNA